MQSVKLVFLLYIWTYGQRWLAALYSEPCPSTRRYWQTGSTIEDARDRVFQAAWVNMEQFWQQMLCTRYIRSNLPAYSNCGFGADQGPIRHTWWTDKTFTKKVCKKIGAYFTHFERIAKIIKKSFKILLSCTCGVKKNAALLHSQSGSTALTTISASGSGRPEAKFFDMMKRVTR